jgi:hypothetical protein
MRAYCRLFGNYQGILLLKSGPPTGSASCRETDPVATRILVGGNRLRFRDAIDRLQNARDDLVRIAL